MNEPYLSQPAIPTPLPIPSTAPHTAAATMTAEPAAGPMPSATGDPRFAHSHSPSRADHPARTLYPDAFRNVGDRERDQLLDAYDKF